MSVFLYWSGLFFWCIIGIVGLWCLYAIAKDGVQCARFVYRRIRLGGWKEEVGLPQKAYVSVRLWLHYWVSGHERPDYITFEGGQRAYWPGAEPN